MDKKLDPKRKQAASSGERAEPITKRKRSASLIAKETTALGPKSPGIPTQAQLDAAKPAEGKARYDGQFKSGYDEYDGVWLCCNNCCRNENCVKHYEGAHPFKYLKCRRCDHIVCLQCCSSEILTPVRSIDMEPSEERFDSSAQQVRYCQLCCACGLTYRGTFENGQLVFPSDCPCGKYAAEGESFIHFFIGSNEAYRIDPQAAIVTVRLDDRLAALARITKKRRSDSVQSPTSSPIEGACEKSRQAVDDDYEERVETMVQQGRRNAVVTASHPFFLEIEQRGSRRRTAVDRLPGDCRDTSPSSQ